MKKNATIGDEHIHFGERQKHQKQIKPERVEIESGSFKMVSEDGACVGTKLYLNGKELREVSRAVIVADADAGLIKIHLTLNGTKHD